MNKNEIKEKLIEICTKTFPNQDIDADLIEYMDFVDDMGMDSMTFISIVVEIETLFEITVPDDLILMENFRRVEDIVELIAIEFEVKGRMAK